MILQRRAIQPNWRSEKFTQFIDALEEKCFRQQQGIRPEETFKLPYERGLFTDNSTTDSIPSNLPPDCYVDDFLRHTDWRSFIFKKGFDCLLEDGKEGSREGK